MARNTLAEDYRAIEPILSQRIRFNRTKSLIEIDTVPLSFDRLHIDLAIHHSIEISDSRLKKIVRYIAHNNPHTEQS